MAEEKSIDLIFKNSPHYDNIVNFDYSSDDIISKSLITCYQDQILDNNEDIENQKLIAVLDMVVNEYVSNPKFYRYIHSSYEYDVNDNLVEVIIKMYKQYEEIKMQEIENTRWL